MKTLPSRLALLAAGALAACNMNVAVDPEGLVCDPGGVCPLGYVCVTGNICHAVSGVGGGSGGGASGGSGGGNGGGVGGGGTCGGLLCDQPAAPQCFNANTLRTHNAPGTCTDGSCEYSFSDRNCPNGCAGGLCIGDPCTGMGCITPPPPACKDPNTLTTFGNTGTCSNGQCSYAAASTFCTMGCADGMCQNQNLCGGIVCNMPQSPTCVGNAARTFMSPGTCNPGTGICSYNPIDAVCPNGCAGGICITPGQAFTQTMPRIPFAVNAIDQAPNSAGSHVLVVGDKGSIMKWNGSTFAWVTSSSATTANLNGVWFAGANAALVVGSSRTVARYSGTGYTVLTGVPAGLGAGNLLYVHGKDESNFTIADESANWWRFTATTWTNGTFAAAVGTTYKTRGVFVDASNRARIVGQRNMPTGNNGVVHYFEPTVPCAPCEDIDRDGGTDGFGAVGPAINGLATAPDSAFLGRMSTNTAREHNDAAPFYDSVFTPALTLPSGAGISAITGASGATRAVFFLENVTASTVGHLYRYSGATGVDATALGDFYFDKVSMGANESGGVVLAETDTTNGVNNVYRRNAVFGEMLDLAESWAVVTSTGVTLVLVSDFGDLAFRVGGGPTWQFRRGPFVSVLDATSANGAGALVVGKAGAMERFIAGTLTPTVTSIASGTTNDLTGICRVSDSEAYAVANGGVIRLVNTTAATSTAMTSPTTKNLLAVDCPLTGAAVACGQGGLVLRLTGTTWATVVPAFPAAADLASCKLVGTTIFAAGDNAFYKLDLSASAPAWQQLPAISGLSHLQVISPSEVYALSAGTKVVRYDGSSWTPRFAANSGTLVGGGQVGGKVVYAGSLGMVVEGQ